MQQTVRWADAADSEMCRCSRQRDGRMQQTARRADASRHGEKEKAFAVTSSHSQHGGSTRPPPAPEPRLLSTEIGMSARGTAVLSWSRSLSSPLLSSFLPSPSFVAAMLAADVSPKRGRARALERRSQTCPLAQQRTAGIRTAAFGNTAAGGLHTNAGMVLTYKRRHSAYIQTQTRCLHTNAGMVLTYKRRHGAYIQTQAWCLHTNAGMVPTYKRRHGAYIQTQAWCLHTNAAYAGEM
ncbi:uncharacterized protein M421DRAFT_217473 [Didymella exigua CBS 183.55]|uniref:Uncharacterized protein n=1 Tax=Didymella exigua CBS 183.55 TaxID=1150837 RepID=A0A6A5RDY7_9PLEO|nr:uncharacterized protein M421DRAFT_217473 [Didymella exigua CBS 183.55]KAF1926491.1 hypothetical protein M421DRAFT_217473 [Didymella exigua CBS 183.55]